VIYPTDIPRLGSQSFFKTDNIKPYEIRHCHTPYSTQQHQSFQTRSIKQLKFPLADPSNFRIYTSGGFDFLAMAALTTHLGEHLDEAVQHRSPVHRSRNPAKAHTESRGDATRSHESTRKAGRRSRKGEQKSGLSLTNLGRGRRDRHALPAQLDFVE
jgi:hypothetical protein